MGHLADGGVLLADGIAVRPQKVLQEPVLLQGLSQRFAFVQRDPEEKEGLEGGVDPGSHEQLGGWRR